MNANTKCITNANTKPALTVNSRSSDSLTYLTTYKVGLGVTSPSGVLTIFYQTVSCDSLSDET